MGTVKYCYLGDKSYCSQVVYLVIMTTFCTVAAVFLCLIQASTISAAPTSTLTKRNELQELLNAAILQLRAEEPITKVCCIERTKVFGSNLLFSDGTNFATAETNEECLDLCDQYEGCESVEFNPEYQKCQMNDRVLGDDDAVGEHDRWVYCHREIVKN